ncbi:MAG TPA: potassium channel protein [Solirubrobacteraceae bacterium]|jgi:voltage-gated potassium channel
MPNRPESLDRRRAIDQRLRARHELRLFTRRLGILLAVLLGVVIAGTLGYSIGEGTSVGYGAEWTLDTITTVGAIPNPHDTGARVLKVCLEVIGIGTLFYGLVTVAEFFVSGQLSGMLEERRIQRMIDSYSNHYIVCGFGRVGRQVARDLKAAGVEHVVIDPNPENREVAQELGVAYIESEAADDEVLRAAGIERARGVIACVDSDAENIFIALTARELRSDIRIVARASVEESEKKLLRAGADRVISPYKTSGVEMARMALHPQVGGVLEFEDLRMEEIVVTPPCEGEGKTIEAVRGQSVIVALRRQGGQLEAQPAPQTVVGAGDLLVALGPPDALERLEHIFQPEGA